MRRGSSKSSIFLLELILAILFFAVASAVCVQLFVRAHLISAGSRDLNRAVLCAQSVAESFKAQNGEPELVARHFGASAGDGGFTLFYDGDWKLVEGKGAYALTLEVERDAGMRTGNIAVQKAGEPEPLYRLQVKKYVPEPAA